MVEKGYANKQFMELSAASSSTVSRLKRQYLAELRGETIKVHPLIRINV